MLKTWAKDAGEKISLLVVVLFLGIFFLCVYATVIKCILDCNWSNFRAVIFIVLSTGPEED